MVDVDRGVTKGDGMAWHLPHQHVAWLVPPHLLASVSSVHSSPLPLGHGSAMHCLPGTTRPLWKSTVSVLVLPSVPPWFYVLAREVPWWITSCGMPARVTHPHVG